MGQEAVEAQPGLVRASLDACARAGFVRHVLSRAEFDAMRGVMIVAIVMGVMIVTGTIVLIAVIIGRFEHPAAPAAVARPYAAPIAIPRGARVAAMAIAADRLVVDLALPQGDQEIVVINLATGKRLGTIELRTAP
ncbi:MAG: DUF6476 family protein [Stellaceae bacterium]